MKTMNLVLVGVGGYGAGTLRAVLDHGAGKNVQIAGIVEPYPNSCPYMEEVSRRSIPVYASMASFYEHGAADLAVISSPIQFHAEQAVYAMEHESHVLLEKPVTADMQGFERIRAAQEKTGKRCAVGYQWCFNPAMLALKRDILAGVFGAPVSMRSITLWPRTESYYRRGIGWAGKRSDAQGRAVNDSVASNATAHYLMNMLWLLGEKMDAAAELHETRSATARVNAIEMFDTIILRGVARGADVLYIASHAVEQSHEPEFEYVFERGTLHFSVAEGDAPLTVRLDDGSTRIYEGMACNDEERLKLWTVVEALRGEGMIPCTAEAAAMHVRAMEFVNARPISDLSQAAAHAYDAGRELHYIPGLAEKLLDCYSSFGEPFAYIT